MERMSSSCISASVERAPLTLTTDHDSWSWCSSTQFGISLSTRRVTRLHTTTSGRSHAVSRSPRFRLEDGGVWTEILKRPSHRLAV